MATVDGRPAQYGLSRKQLQALMELRGWEAVEELDQLGGVKGVCNELCTSSTKGMHFSLSPCAASSVVTCCNFAGLSGSTKDIEHRQQTFGSNTIPSKPSLCRFVKEALQIVVVIILGVGGICFFLSLLNSKAAGKDRSLFLSLKCRSETSLSMRY
jgi:Cation transporter/ATPase, N-terminus